MLIDDMLETSGRLHDVVFNAVEYLNHTEHNGTLDLLRTNMCTLMQEMVLEALDIMVRMGYVHCSLNYQLAPSQIQTYAVVGDVYVQGTTRSDKMCSDKSVCYWQ